MAEKTAAELAEYWATAMRQPANQLKSKTDQMLQKAGLLPTEGDPLHDPLFLPERQANYRDRIRRHIANWNSNIGASFQNPYDHIACSYADPVVAYADRREVGEAKARGVPINLPTWQYVAYRDRAAYDLLVRGFGERDVASQTNLDVLEVREVANRHGLTTHL